MINDKNHIEVKKEDVVIMEVYQTSDGILGCNHPENNTVPIYALIGFLEVYIQDLKDQAQFSFFKEKE